MVAGDPERTRGANTTCPSQIRLIQSHSQETDQASRLIGSNGRVDVDTSLYVCRRGPLTTLGSKPANNTADGSSKQNLLGGCDLYPDIDRQACLAPCGRSDLLRGELCGHMCELIVKIGTQ